VITSNRRRWLAARHTTKRRSGGGSMLLPIVGILLLGMLVMAGGLVGMGALAGVATVATLEQGLPDPSELERLDFDQPTTVYDRTGETELGRFLLVNRRAVTYREIPRLVLDATTTAEDRTFWANEGYDVAAIMSAIAENTAGLSERGASTITQQLVRARLLPTELTAPGADRYERKAKEVLQAARVTEAYPGEDGKERIIAAYLNEIYYGHDAYGVAAAAERYFGVTELKRLTPAQAALLAGLPKSPSALDPYLYATQDDEGRLVVAPESPPVVRRNWILRNMADSRWTRLTRNELRTALREPVVLAGDRPLVYTAPHAMWRIRDELVGMTGRPPPSGSCPGMPARPLRGLRRAG
jgi:penicillin-binding protein 1A